MEQLQVRDVVTVDILEGERGIEERRDIAMIHSMLFLIKLMNNDILVVHTCRF